MRIRNSISFVLMLFFAVLLHVNAADPKPLLKKDAPEARLKWLELYTAIQQAMPVDDRYKSGESPDPKKIPFADRREIYVDQIETRFFEDLTQWYTKSTKLRHRIDLAAAGRKEQPRQPKGAGWVVEMKGHHFHNSRMTLKDGTGAKFLRNTFIKSLRDGKFKFAGPDGEAKELSFSEFGISHVMISESNPIDRGFRIANPDFDEQKKGNVPRDFAAPRYEFTIQFVWQPRDND